MLFWHGNNSYRFNVHFMKLIEKVIFVIGFAFIIVVSVIFVIQVINENINIPLYEV